VVKNFVNNASIFGAEFGVECIPVIMQGRSVFPLNGLADQRYFRTKPALVASLDSFYLWASRGLAAYLPFRSIRRFLLANRREAGLAWCLYYPVRALKRLPLIWVPRQSSPAGIEDSLGPSDILFLPDAFWAGRVSEIIPMLRERGVRIAYFIHDVIPFSHPNFCVSEHVKRFLHCWQSVTRLADLLVYNSRYTREMTEYYIKMDGVLPPKGAVVYLGHDFRAATTKEVTHPELGNVLALSSNAFLCVGTLEPKKNQNTIIDAFEKLWKQHVDASIIFVGRAGWLYDDLLVRIKRHPEFSNRLFWFDDVNDSDLVLAYQRCSALVYSSIVEGFGLPLVEALSLGTPVIASDIPVFREIADGHARFFPPTDSFALAEAVKAHIATPERSAEAGSQFRWPTWRDSTRNLLSEIHDLVGDR